MTDLLPLPEPDCGTIRVGRADIPLNHSDEAMQAYARACVEHALAGRGQISDPMIRERSGDWDSGRFPDRDSERNAGMGSAPATNNPPSHVQGDSSPQHLTASAPNFYPAHPKGATK